MSEVPNYPVLAQCYSCWNLTCVDTGVGEVDRTCPECKDRLARLPVYEPSDIPAVHVKHPVLHCPRRVIGERLLQDADQWARKHGRKLVARDKQMVAETRKRVDAVKKSGKQPEIRMAARLPGRWFAEKRLLIGESFMSDPGRIEHEAKRDNLWLDKD
jgi:hypothetical protein